MRGLVAVPLRQLLALAALVVAAPAVTAQDAAAGRQHFFDYCAACHGAEARGNGPLAEMLAITTPDLTGLAARNGGLFPTAAVVAQIDGRDPLRGHGGSMPVFGRFFEGEDAAMKTPSGQPILTSRPIVDLVAWLEEIQEE